MKMRSRSCSKLNTLMIAHLLHRAAHGATATNNNTTASEAAVPTTSAATTTPRI
jgi:hypothetical protein